MSLSESRRRHKAGAYIVAFFMFAGIGHAQEYTQRGFVETRGTFYPQKATNDPARFVGDTLFRYEGFFRPTTQFQINGALPLEIKATVISTAPVA